MFQRIGKAWKRFRSAVTGRFVTRKEAQADPERTVGESVERKGK